VAYKLDLFIVRQRDMKRVRDAGAVGWRGVDSDHCAIGLRLAIARNLKKQKSAGRPGRIDRRALREPATLEKFVAAAKEHMAAAVTVGATAGVPAPTKLQVPQSVAMAAAHEALWTTARRKPDWYAAAADTLDPLIMERNAAQLAHTIRHHIKSEALHQRLGIHSVGRYYHNRLLQWGGRIARMSMDRLPRMILTGWVAHPRPTGCPQMTFGRTLNNALK
jgi:hypothetical protein